MVLGTWYTLNITDFYYAVWRNYSLKLHHGVGGGGLHYVVLGGVKTFHYVILKGFVLLGIVSFSLTSPRS